MQISILKEERNDLKYENEKLHDIQNLLDLNLEQNKALTRELKEKEIELDKGKKSRTYKLNVTLKKEIKEALDKIDVLNAENEELKTKVLKVMSKLMGAQTTKSNPKKSWKGKKRKTRCCWKNSNLLMMMRTLV